MPESRNRIEISRFFDRGRKACEKPAGASFRPELRRAQVLANILPSGIFEIYEKRGAMMPTVSQLIVWIIVGLIGGGLASRLITWDREGFGTFRNLGLGLVGALIGGFLFRLFNLLPGLDKVSVSLRDVVAAVAGSLIILGAIWLVRRYRK
jgi:uncharacterized membrane protein YeaQ/YmgE (transglycosylase-associated protein family)